MLGTLKYWYRMDQHEHGEDNEVKTSKRFGQSFVVAREESKAVKRECQNFRVQGGVEIHTDDRTNRSA